MGVQDRIRKFEKNRSVGCAEFKRCGAGIPAKIRHSDVVARDIDGALKSLAIYGRSKKKLYDRSRSRRRREV